LTDPGPESIEIRTRDGQALGAALREPHKRRILGTAVLAHPMFANKSVFERPRKRGLAQAFVEAGWRTLAFDFRGHGESRPRDARDEPWSYDDLVTIDLPAVVDAARSRWPRLPVVLVGHSLGGHVALASQGAGLVHADALIPAAANVWQRRLEPSRRIWALKLATAIGMDALARRHRYFPARALRLGSDDEAAPYISDLTRFTLTGTWTSKDRKVDYAAGLRSIDVPTLALTSEGDRLYCRVESARRWMLDVPDAEHHVITAAECGGKAPGHMAIVTGDAARGAWKRALEWLGAVLPGKR
jgi:predicted alpha/beta hydrolase